LLVASVCSRRSQICCQSFHSRCSSPREP
jgi:hypothetical protein